MAAKKGYIITNEDDSAEAPGGVIMTRREISDANATVTTADHDIIYTALTAARTVTLPLANTLIKNRMFNIKDEVGKAGSFNIIIATSGSDTIEGGSSVILNVNKSSLTIYTDGISKFFIK